MQMTGKNNRILDLYARLMNGETISKRECAGKYGVNEKVCSVILTIYAVTLP